MTSPQIDYDLIRQIVREEIQRALSTPEPLRVDAKELSRRLGKSLTTVERWAKRRIIPREKIGRTVMYDLAAVDAALKKWRRNAIG